MDKFLLSLKKETALYKDDFREERFDTIFFGGGTPSLLSPVQLNSILEYLHSSFNISADTEITMEANPEDFDEAKFTGFKNAGVNRISFGVQSFIDKELKFLTRQHTAGEAESVIGKALKIFDNVSLDIIFSLPGQTKEDLDHSLTRAIETGAGHVSAYTLTYEERTPLYKQYEKKLVSKNSDTAEAVLYEYVSSKLTSAGFDQYEVSNFAKEGFRSKHNLKYWQYENYLGLGPSSHSFHKKKRWNNYRDIIKYNNMLERGERPVESINELSKDQMKLEFNMLALRSTGVDVSEYRRIFEEDFEKEYENSITGLISSGHATFNGSVFKLNTKGYAIADGIIAKYF